MAWIEAHDTLPDHPKVLRAAKALRLDADALLGKLIRLWTWALNHREDGVLSDLDAAILHRIMNFSGRADKLLSALLEARPARRPARRAAMPSTTGTSTPAA